LTGRRAANHTNRLSRRVSTLNGQLTEGNGFNCTHGHSAYRSPCKSLKAGLLEIRRDPKKHGHPVPLFVNLVCHTRPKLAAPRPGSSYGAYCAKTLIVCRAGGATDGS